jgi:hypothetical protein
VPPLDRFVAPAWSTVRGGSVKRGKILRWWRVPPRRDASAADRGADPPRLAVRPAGRRYLCNYDGMSERFEWLCPQAHAGSCPCAGDQLQGRSPTMPLALGLFGLCGPAGVIAVTAVVPVARSRSQSSTFRLRVGCSASIWTAPDGSSLLTLGALSVQTAPDGYRRIVWMIKWMIKAHPTENRMPQAIWICLGTRDHTTRLGRRMKPAGVTGPARRPFPALAYGGMAANQRRAVAFASVDPYQRAFGARHGPRHTTRSAQCWGPPSPCW